MPYTQSDYEREKAEGRPGMTQTQHTPGPREIVGGAYSGHLIRRARKDWKCDAATGWPEIHRCKKPIPAGSYYVEGDVDPGYAGGFGHERYCADCVDEPARAAITKARGEG